MTLMTSNATDKKRQSCPKIHMEYICMQGKREREGGGRERKREGGREREREGGREGERDCLCEACHFASCADGHTHTHTNTHIQTHFYKHTHTHKY